jgi:alpha-glucuronidase
MGCTTIILRSAHHLAWDYAVRSGRSLWEELVRHYDEGVAAVQEMQRVWAHLSHWVDDERFDQVIERNGLDDGSSSVAWTSDASEDSQTQKTDDDQVDCHYVVQQSRDDQDQNAGDE